jgi:hypothetical protein
MHDDELTRDEREAMEKLPREGALPASLESRVVMALRREGLLQAPAPLALPGRVPPAWIGVAAAASLALFFGGFALGGWIESRHTADLLVDMRREDVATAAMAAAEVQRTGSEYVRALTLLASLADTTRGQSVDEGREVATSALHAAASQLVRMSPEDPVAVSILQGIERSNPTDSLRQGPQRPRRTLWF